jgi:hypothetical protein
MGDGWAWVSLSVLSRDLSPEAVRGLLPGSVASRQNPRLAAVEFGGRGGQTSLQALLDELADYLESHRGNLPGSLRQADFQLRIGWSPRTPQECVAIPSAVVEVLAALHADVMIDAYDATDEIAEPAPGA